MDTIKEVKDKLSKYKTSEIIITDHAYSQAIFREISISEIRENIINPVRLIIVNKQQSKLLYEKKYDCYFKYADNEYHRYILAINSKCVVCTVIKFRRRINLAGVKNEKI